MKLLGTMRTNHVHPSFDVESCHRVPTLLSVTCIWGAFYSKVFNSVILRSSIAFIASYDVTIAVIDPSKVSWMDVEICS